MAKTKRKQGRPFKRKTNRETGDDSLVEIRMVYRYIRANPGARVKSIKAEAGLNGDEKYKTSRWPAIRDYMLRNELVFTRDRGTHGRSLMYYPTNPDFDWPIEQPTNGEAIENQVNEPLEEMVSSVAPRVSMAGQFTDCIEVAIHDRGGNVVQRGTFGSIADIAMEHISGATLHLEVTRTAEGQSVVRLEVHLA